MPREKITLTAEFKAAVKEYQKANDFKSWAAALVYLATIGYEKETGQTAPGPLATWGGWRGKKA
jgi:hypothetical protein